MAVFCLLMEKAAAQKKIRTIAGTVVSDKMQKTRVRWYNKKDYDFKIKNIFFKFKILGFFVHYLKYLKITYKKYNIYQGC